MTAWETAFRLRSDRVNGVLETAHADKRIGKSLEAHVALFAKDEDTRPRWRPSSAIDLPEIFIVSNVSTDEAAPAEGAVVEAGVSYLGLTVAVSEAKGTKCPRCWMHPRPPDEHGLLPSLRRCPQSTRVLNKLKPQLPLPDPPAGLFFCPLAAERGEQCAPDRLPLIGGSLWDDPVGRGCPPAAADFVGERASRARPSNLPRKKVTFTKISVAPSIDGNCSKATSYKLDAPVSGGAYQDARKVRHRVERQTET